MTEACKNRVNPGFYAVNPENCDRNYPLESLKDVSEMT